MFDPRALRAIRRKRGLTQIGVALAMGNGTTPARVSSWENGKHKPRAASISRLALALGCSEADLMVKLRHVPAGGQS